MRDAEDEDVHILSGPDLGTITPRRSSDVGVVGAQGSGGRADARGMETELERILRTIRPDPKSRGADGGGARICVAPDCSTKLSRYNPGDLCGVHAPIYGSRKW